MKKSFVIFIVFIVLTGKLSATDHHFLVLESEKTAKLFSFGPGIGIGFFYPKDLNTYIQDYFNDKYSKTVNIDIYEYFLINATASFLFSPYTELQVETEYAVAKLDEIEFCDKISCMLLGIPHFQLNRW